MPDICVAWRRWCSPGQLDACNPDARGAPHKQGRGAALLRSSAPATHRCTTKLPSVEMQTMMSRKSTRGCRIQRPLLQHCCQMVPPAVLLALRSGLVRAAQWRCKACMHGDAPSASVHPCAHMVHSCAHAHAHTRARTHCCCAATTQHGAPGGLSSVRATCLWAEICCRLLRSGGCCVSSMPLASARLQPPQKTAVAAVAAATAGAPEWVWHSSRCDATSAAPEREADCSFAMCGRAFITCRRARPRPLQ